MATVAELEALAANDVRGYPELARSPVMRRLYELAESRGVRVLWTTLLPAPVNGLYFQDQGRPGILLSRRLRGPARSYVFAHELGHHVLQHKGSVFASPARAAERRAIVQAEAEADRFARRLLCVIRQGTQRREPSRGGG